MVAFIAVFGIIFALFLFGVLYMVSAEAINEMITIFNTFITAGDFTGTGASYINVIVGIGKMLPLIFMIGLVLFCIVYAIEKKAV